MSQKQAYVRKKVCQRKNNPQKKKGFFLSQKQVLVMESSFFFLVTLRKTNFCHRKKVSGTEKVSVTENKSRSSGKKSSFTEASFCQKQNSVKEKSFSHKKVSFTKTNFCNRNKSCPHRPFQLKVLYNYFLFFFWLRTFATIFSVILFSFQNKVRGQHLLT